MNEEKRLNGYLSIFERLNRLRSLYGQIQNDFIYYQEQYGQEEK